MTAFVKSLLTSKKWVTAMAGILADTVVLVAPASVVAPELRANLLLVISGLVGAYLVSQGFADFGKESEKIRDSRERGDHPRPGGGQS
jgi:hypothetical protein